MALDDREITYGDVTFKIGKLLPKEAKQVFMRHVRPLMEGALAASGDGNLLQMALAVIAKAPQDHYDALMDTLYRHITFSSPSSPTLMVLHGNDEMAFKDLEAAHILLLEARVFAVNFRGSLDVLRSEFPQLDLLFQPSDPEISTPSSTIQ